MNTYNYDSELVRESRDYPGNELELQIPPPKLKTSDLQQLLGLRKLITASFAALVAASPDNSD